jgi:hypothetical protein
MQASNGLRSIRRRILVDPDDAVYPGHGVAVRAQARAESCHAHGAIVAVAHRFFAAPHDFHGTIELFGDGYGLPDIVVLIAAAKSAADKAVVDVNVLLRNAGYFRRIQQRFFRSLRSHPYVHAIRRDLSGAVQTRIHSYIVARIFTFRSRSLR